jgi:hypothetical protein
MRYTGRVLLLLTLLSLSRVLWAHPDHGAHVPPPVVFRNFDQTIELTRDNDVFSAVELDVNLRLENRIVAKVTSGVSANQLAELHKQITDVSLLYDGHDFRYYLVTTKHLGALRRVLKRLGKSSHVISAQPDLLQLSNKRLSSVSSAKDAGNIDLWRDYKKHIGVESLQRQGAGRGVKIAVIDDGFSLSHATFSHLKK